MDRLKLAAGIAFVAGAALLAKAAADGALRVGLLLVIPFVHGTGPYAAGGFLLLVLAAVLWMVSRAGPTLPPPSEVRDEGPRETPVERRHGGVLLLGPIPIVWGSDRRVLPWMVGAGLALLALSLLLAWALRR